jgi:hypothetical protein
MTSWPGKIVSEQAIQSRPQGKVLSQVSRMSCRRLGAVGRYPDGISQNVKHVSIISDVFAAAGFIPIDNQSQYYDAVGEQFKKHGVLFGAELVSKSGPNPDINVEICLITPELALYLTLLNSTLWTNCLQKSPSC